MAIYIDDKELVAAHQAGDTEAFEELVREYRPALFAHGRRKLYCEATAEDAVQETLVRAYRALPKFNGEYRLGPWLHRIMANVCVDEINRRRRDGEKVEKISAQPVTEFGVPSVEDELGLYFDGNDVNDALNGLPDSYSEALKLRFVDELDYDQVAEIAGVSEQNARARVSRARVVMRAALKGVGAFPVLLLGILRRGEKAAAAATSSAGAAVTTASTATSGTALSLTSNAVPVASAMPSVAEAAIAISQATPAVVPALTKAVVGIGLAAAVLTPTSDSAVHRAMGDISSSETFATTELVPKSNSNPVEIMGEALVDENIESSEASKSFGTQSSELDSEVAGSAESLPRFERGTVSQEVEQDNRLEGSLQGSVQSLSLMLQGGGSGRYFLSGEVALTYNGSEVRGFMGAGSLISLESEEDQFGENRLDGLLIIENGSGDIVEMRLAGFAVKDRASHKIGGLFSISGFGDRPLQRGTFQGAVQLPSAESMGSLEITLAR